MSGNGKKTHTGMLTTGLACGISLFLLLIFFLFVFAFGGDEGYELKNAVQQGETQVAGALSFTAASYEVEASQEMDMSQYLNCQGMDPEDIVWTSSDTDILEVGSKGHIVMNGYGQSCVLIASSKENDTVYAECTIMSRSEEDDFVFQVESLNGGHEQDEVTDDGTVKVAYSAKERQTIDVKAQNFTVGTRNDDAVWDKKLFYELEEINPNSDKDGKINSYRVERKKLIDQNSGNEVEYEIYHHPDTDKINKIVSIEYLDKKLAIVEYYYTDDGKVNFVYSYEDVNYAPSYATPDRDGERYLFNNDTMVTWRIVKDKKETNYCYTKAEKKRVESSGRKAKLYADCDNDRKKQYDNKEKKILNAAYNTLEKVQNCDGVSTISGHLEMASGEGVKEAQVVLESVDYNKKLFTALTDETGYYEIHVPIHDFTYNLEFEKDGYIDETLYDIESEENVIDLSQEIVYLAEEDEQNYYCELFFYDALNKSFDGMGMEILSDLDVIIRRGVNNRSGEAVYEGHIDGNSGTVELAPGMYTVQMIKDNYMDTYSSLFVSKDTGNRLSIYATPELNEDEYRIVLTWNETPRDLDSHLFAPNDTGNGDYHICYYHMSDNEGNTSLDVDDVDGYGPETTTINHIKQGHYKFYVSDFTNCSMNNEESMDMSRSSATVRVYGKQGLIQTFYVPVNQKGVIWEVFEIRDGTVIPIQRYYDAIGNKTWWRMDK
ncbi:MAG: hypothetical protein ACI4S2_00825 [Lachnospiraceae bacterium]